MKLQLLGDRTASQFLAHHWQKRPLVVRQALPEFRGVISPSRLFRLANRDDVESRLVSRTRSRAEKWSVAHGPFSRPELERQAGRNWTLLVQGLNLHVAAADRLLRRFAFIPYARLDDIMVSYAVPGGGVGPHTDSYDVFLLQAQGRRLWRIGPAPRPKFKPGLDLRILDDFEATEEYLMEAGDLLYLPPGWGHDGIALDECMTYSVGFRSPARRELLSEFLLRMSERMDLPGLYRDPDLKHQAGPARIPSGMVDKTRALVDRLRFTRSDIERFLGEYLSEPKPSVVFRRPARALSRSGFNQAMVRHGVQLDARTIMLYRGKRLFINGESAPVAHAAMDVLRQLADNRLLPPGIRKGLPEDLYDWYAAGWLHAQASGMQAR